MSTVYFDAIGRRKSAVAWVRLTQEPGGWLIKRNGKTFDLKQMPAEEQQIILKIFHTAHDPNEKFEDAITIQGRVSGGGFMGQLQALQLAVARALQKMDPELRSPLKKAGLLTRDSRVKERKKPGRPGARKRFQFSKR